jgi:hypothetical protein
MPPVQNFFNDNCIVDISERQIMSEQLDTLTSIYFIEPPCMPAKYRTNAYPKLYIFQ